MNYDSGVYILKNTKTNKFYIGSSSSLSIRKIRHFSDLKNNRHPNKYLQNAWNKDGGEWFVFKILLYCDLSNLENYEQSILDFYWSTKRLYNISTTTDSPNRIRWSIDQERYILERYLSMHSLTEISKEFKVSDSTIKKVLSAHGIKIRRGKEFSEEDKLEIVRLRRVEEKTIKYIAGIFRVDVSKINSILTTENISVTNIKHYKLSPDDLKDIYYLMTLNVSQKDIMQEYNLSKPAMARLKNKLIRNLDPKIYTTSKTGKIIVPRKIVDYLINSSESVRDAILEVKKVLNAGRDTAEYLVKQCMTIKS